MLACCSRVMVWEYHRNWLVQTKKLNSNYQRHLLKYTSAAKMALCCWEKDMRTLLHDQFLLCWKRGLNFPFHTWLPDPSAQQSLAGRFPVLYGQCSGMWLQSKNLTISQRMLSPGRKASKNPALERLQKSTPYNLRMDETMCQGTLFIYLYHQDQQSLLLRWESEREQTSGWWIMLLNCEWLKLGTLYGGAGFLFWATIQHVLFCLVVACDTSVLLVSDFHLWK